MQDISKKELEKVYYDNTNQKAMEILNVSQGTLISMIKNAGLPLKGKSGGKRKYNITD